MRIPGLWRVENYLSDIMYSKLAKKMSKDPRKNYLIFGDPRGGTTWVAEVIQSVIETSLIWEPLSIGTVKEFRQLGFGWRQFIPENENWPEAKSAFTKVFQGKVLNNWMAKQTNPIELQSDNPLLIKFCRGNQILPWLTKNFSFDRKPLYVVRHPYAVAASQLKQGGWDFKYGGFEIPNTPYNEVYKHHESFMKSLKTKTESLVAHWCLTNQVPLNHPNNNKDWITINYENLVMSQRESWSRIFSAWGIEIDISTLSLDTHSSTTVTGSPISGKKQIESWVPKFNRADLERMNAVLEYFEIEVYNESPLPLINYNMETKS